MTAFDKVRARIVDRTGADGHNGMFRCPSHDDSTASLSLTAATDGRVLLHCHAGCEPNRVVDALGLTAKDLFEQRTNGTKLDITATYDYTDEDGKLLYQVVRLTPKDFRQRRPNGKGGWTWKLGDVRKVPYRLPAVLAAVEAGRWIVIVEGEKDVETLERIGITATTNAQGAGKWPPEFAAYLKGARVAIIPDNDRPGTNHAEKVASSLLGIAAKVVRIAPPSRQPGGDISDWAAEQDDLEAGIANLKRIIKGAEPWEPDTANGADGTRVPCGQASPEDGAALLDELARFTERFVVFPNSHYTTAVVLWTMHTHCIDAFEVTPRLALISETKQSGKSRALEVIDLTAARSRYVGAMTTAYLFRLVDSERPTLLFDEVDAVFGPKARDHEELRALINVGFRRSATVGRCVGDGSRQTPTEFAAFSALAMAGIGADSLPDTVLDRSIVLRMRRRAPDEPVESLRYRRVRPEAEALRTRLETWAAAHVDAIRDADPEMPEGITDRPADTWEALLAVADAAGGEWPGRSRRACEVLNNARSAEDGNLAVRLLADIRALGLNGHVFSADLCEQLNAVEESAWSGWNNGKGIQPRDLARRLKGFGIESKQVRIGDESRKGYDIEAFADSFLRYLTTVPPEGNKGNKGNVPARSVSDVSDVSEEERNETGGAIAFDEQFGRPK